MPLTDQQSRFVTKYLGQKAESGRQTREAAVDPRVVLQAGRRVADESLETLRTRLKSLKHPDLARLSDAAFESVLAAPQSALERALAAHAASGDEARQDTATRVMEEVAAFRIVLTDNPVIRLCEANPFGATVTIRAPLIAALDRIERAVTTGR